MCVVEVEGQRGLVPSCAFPAAAGLKVQTHSAARRRRAADAGRAAARQPPGRLPLLRRATATASCRTLAAQLGVRRRRYFGGRTPAQHGRREPVDRPRPGQVHPVRQVRARVRGGAGGRRDRLHRPRQHDAQVGTAFDEGLNVSSCVNCGQCVAVCPTGALRRDARDRRRARGARRPATDRRRPARAVGVREPGGGVRPQARHRRGRPAGDRPAAARLRLGVRHGVHGRPHDHGGGVRAGAPPRRTAARCP